MPAEYSRPDTLLICLTEALLFFFFQGEDGIRDSSVTGVQTCALPISPGGGPSRAARSTTESSCGGCRGGSTSAAPAGRAASRGRAGRTATSPAPAPPAAPLPSRSGERRGGEEGRSRWSPDHLKKKVKKKTKKGSVIKKQSSYIERDRKIRKNSRAYKRATTT